MEDHKKKTHKTHSRPKPQTAYQELNSLLVDVKNGVITVTDALNRVQLREQQQSVRPYAKITEEGDISLYGISKEPITLNIEEWDKLSKTIKASYIENYIKFNEERIMKKQFLVKQRSLFTEDGSEE